MSAFVSKRGTTRVPITPEDFPCLEKAEWVDIISGATVEMMAEINTDGNPMISFVKKAIVGWSFDEELTLDSVKDLDLGIALHVWAEVQKNLPLALQTQPLLTTED